MIDYDKTIRKNFNKLYKKGDIKKKLGPGAYDLKLQSKKKSFKCNYGD